MINKFIHALKDAPAGDVFNPWWDIDERNDTSRSGPEIRRRHLYAFLGERIEAVKYLLVAEALGYQGGHFSGIPMTSERILLGHVKNVDPDHIIRVKPKRTSKLEICPNGFSEPTATIVWNHILSLRINTRDIVLWNAFPWHPYDPERGLLSNRTPSGYEMTRGVEILINLINLVKPIQVFAIGKKAEAQLARLNIEALPLRHPANGGAGKFRRQFTGYIKAI